MSKGQSIFNALVDSGVGFWDADMDNQTFMLSESLTKLLGFSDEIVTMQEFALKLPEDFRMNVGSKLKSSTEWCFPITSTQGSVWLEIHKIKSSRDVIGHLHYMGTARLMSDEEVGERIVLSGISVETLEPMFKALYLLSNETDFADGVHTILSTIKKQMTGVRTGFVRWDSGDMFTMVESVGATVIDQHGEAVVQNYPIYSRMLQNACETGCMHFFDEKNPLDKQWVTEEKFFIRNGVKAMIVVPIHLGNGKNWGILAVVSPTRSEWSAFDRQWVEMIANWISLCMQRLMLQKESEDQLSLITQSCIVGKFTTWEWMCQTGERKLSEFNGKEFQMSLHSEQDTYQNIHKADHQMFRKAHFDVLNGTSNEIALKVRLRNSNSGHMEWYEMLGKVTSCDADGVPERVIGVARNIDKEVHEEIERRNEIEFQNSIYNNLPAGIEFFNEKGELTYVNDTLIDMFGVVGGRDAIMGLQLFENPNLSEEFLNDVRNNDTAITHFKYNFKKTGKYKSTKQKPLDVIYQMSKLYKNGCFSGYMLVIIDNSRIVSQEHEIDMFYHYFIEIGKFAMIGMCWFADSKNGYVSEQWNINLGIAPETPYVRTLSYCKNVVPEDLEVYGSLLGRIFVGDIDSFQHELRVMHDDGMLHYIKTQFLRLTDVVIGISIDITQSKENEKMLIETRHKAERADMLKSQFLANMSHEIRTPLNAIVGFSDLIANSIDSQEARMYSEIVHNNNKVLLGIIDDIIDLSCIESNTLDMDYANNSVNAMCADIFTQYDARQHSKVEFTFALMPIDVVAHLDKGHVMQVVGNFISNAFKFTAAGRVHFWAEHNGHEIMFNVSDTGCGISPDNLARVYDPYFKVDTFSVGTGLGLSICRGLARLMGGRVEAFSTEGKGSHFRLTIPLIRPEDNAQEKEIQNKSVMLLSNNNETIQFTQYALSDFDLIIEQEHVFMSLWLKKKPYLTIIDQQLFGDSIAVVVASIHSHGPEYRIVVMCPVGVEIDLVAIEEAGATAIVFTPVTQEKFRAAITSCMI